MVVINTIPQYENQKEREASVQRVYIMLQKKINKTPKKISKDDK